MGPELQAHVAFHLTGKRMGAGLQAAERLQLRPGLLARFGDLSQLRHDFPLVLIAGRPDETGIQSLSGIVNDILQSIAPRGIEGEATRRHVLRLERELRTLAASGESGLLSRLWELAETRIGKQDDTALADSLNRARAALSVDGEVVDCTPGLPWHLVTHAWKALQQRKAGRRALELTRLSVRLSDILQADFVRSRAGMSAARLRASVGTGMEDAFDFQAMSATLEPVAGRDPLPDTRRRRVQDALSVLVAHASSTRPEAGPDQFEACTFGNCRDALAAFHDRLPKLVELVKAMAIAELEIEGRYVEATHDPFFADFDEGSVGAGDLRLFPDYLVCLSSESLHSPENAGLAEILASGMPIKVVVQVSDVLEEPALSAHLGPVGTAAQFGRMAMGLGSAWVLQTCSSRLYQARSRLFAGLAHAGPALFSVYSGFAQGTGMLPPYLLAAAALESRAFPEFTYDPGAGPDWTTRFSLDGNPQLGADWPTHEFSYEDEAHRRATEQLAFTFVDFLACDPRHARHFALVPRADWDENLIPVGSCLARDAAAVAWKIPYLHLVDEEHVLRRALVDGKLLAAARRCQESWHGLQELAGVRGPRARSVPAAAPTVVAAPAQAPDATAARPVAEEVAPERPSDDAYIDTPRCTTCNECTNLNNRLFAYDANKQAYIADINAGTYRELVEAAESCQVAIIHPGKPRNPDEPDLAELMKRAEPFR